MAEIAGLAMAIGWRGGYFYPVFVAFGRETRELAIP